MKEDIKYWVGFNNIPGIGHVRLTQLENYFGNLENAWKAPAGELKHAGIDSTALRAINRYRPGISPDAAMERLERYGINVLISRDSSYPFRLKEIYDYPPVIYIRGSLLPEDEWCLAVVGTRRASVYGKQVTEELVTDLARANITIVSGLARGIDTIAHKSALKAGGRTLAVFASGLDIVYPGENSRLAREIMEQGCLLSEYPPGIRPRADNFPRRNRILSGLSLGVLVAEAGETSGAMITARMALEQNREVFAVPGSILSPGSRGTNRLLQEGTKLVREYTDVLEELNLTTVTRHMEMKEILPDTDSEAALLQQLGNEPVHIDEICRQSGLTTATVSVTPAMMELKGMVKQVGTMNYVRCRESRRENKVRVE